MNRRMARLIATTVGVAALSVGLLVTPAAAAPDEGAGINVATFELRSNWNNKCVEILGLNNGNGAGVGAWDCWGGANQRWYWDGTQIRSLMNHKCLEILGVSNSNGAQLGMWDCWGGANQQWYWEGSRLKSYLNHKYVDLLYHDNRNGAWVGMWPWTGQSNQSWRAIYW